MRTVRHVDREVTESGFCTKEITAAKRPPEKMCRAAPSPLAQEIQGLSAAGKETILATRNIALEFHLAPLMGQSAEAPTGRDSVNFYNESSK